MNMHTLATSIPSNIFPIFHRFSYYLRIPRENWLSVKAWGAFATFNNVGERRVAAGVKWAFRPTAVLSYIFKRQDVYGILHIIGVNK